MLNDLQADVGNVESLFLACHLLLFSQYASVQHLREGVKCVRDASAAGYPDAIALDAAISTIALTGRIDPAAATGGASPDSAIVKAHAKKMNALKKEDKSVQMHTLLGYWHFHGVGGIRQSCVVASDHYFAAAEIAVLEIAETGAEPLPLPLLYEQQVCSPKKMPLHFTPFPCR
jgi:hypothetical protein